MTEPLESVTEPLESGHLDKIRATLYRGSFVLADLGSDWRPAIIYKFQSILDKQLNLNSFFRQATLRLGIVTSALPAQQLGVCFVRLAHNPG